MRTIFTVTILLLAISSFSQLGKMNHPSIAQMEIGKYRNAPLQRTSSVGTDYDVKYYRLWLRLNPDTSAGTYIKGNVTTYFTTVQNNFAQIKFDFLNNLNVDSVKYHGTKLAVANYLKDIDTLKINIPSIASSGTLDSITVFYQGAPYSAPWGTGFVLSQHNGSNYIYTLSEPFSAHYWWPCKLDVTDKADSVDLIVNTPVGFKAAGNGTLVSETTDASGVTAFWKHRYAIPAYLVCTAVANYEVHTSPSVNINGTIMPVYHYFFPETNNATVRANADGVDAMISAFSTWFGDYPYKNEKYGHYEFGFGGGMEHSTFSGMHGSTFYSWDIIAHELGHQWFGDGVTCASWGDIWINEGFAQFTEIIAAEKVPALNPYLPGHRSMVKSNALAYNSETTFRTDISSIGTIFSPSPYIYERGAMILNMLRLTLGDAKFFQALQNYQSDPLLKYKNAATADVKRHMENVSGLNLTDFFDNWIYKTGHATYDIAWGNNATNIQFDLAQSRTAGSSSTYFDMPIPIRIQGAMGGQDTTVIIYDDNGIMNKDVNGVLTSTGNGRVSFHLSFVPVTVTFDPDNLSLATATVNNLVILPVHLLELTGKKETTGNQLSWKGNWSGNAVQMDLERSSDGQHFQKIFEPAIADLHSPLSLEYSDAVSSGVNYYRIYVKMEDGTTYYSNVLKLGQKQSAINIFPTPADKYIIIEGENLFSSSSNFIRIYDAKGSLKTTASGNGNVKIDVQNWAPGFYTVEINNDGVTERRKIIVQH